MSLRCLLLLPLTLLSLVLPITPVNSAPLNAIALGNSVANLNKSQQVCPQPALSRLIRHKVVAGETIDSIAQQYSLIPATLMGMNPALQNGKVTVDSEILIPPYNGIRVQVPAGKTWRNVAATYRVRADVLFEVNGCQKAPKVVFVPGVNWSPQRPSIVTKLLSYPLSVKATVALGYGWQIYPDTGKVFFHSGIDLLAATGTKVQAVDAGTVAFAGSQGNYGNLVVVNHQGGRQSRYAQLNTVGVTVGQKVKKGELLGTVGLTGKPTSSKPHLHFEVRYSSSLGWVAEDPGSWLQRPASSPPKMH